MSYSFLSIMIIGLQHIIVFATLVIPWELDTKSLFISFFLVLIGVVWKYYSQYFDFFENQFIVEGPFKYMRYPNILGDVVVTLGIVIACPWFPISMIFLVISLVLFKIKFDLIEKSRGQIHGDKYFEYAHSTPAFLPSLIPFKKTSIVKNERRSINELISIKNQRGLLQALVLFGLGLAYVKVRWELTHPGFLIFLIIFYLVIYWKYFIYHKKNKLRFGVKYK